VIKSLYTRIILTFIGSVILSLVLSFVVYGKIYNGQLQNYMQKNMISNGKTIIHSLEQSNGKSLELLISGNVSLPLYSLRLFNEEGMPLYESSRHSNFKSELSSEKIEKVLAGDVYRSSKSHGFEQVIVGLPFQLEGKAYALFITSEFGGFAKMLSGFFRNQLLIVCLFGSIFIVLAARYIVRPIQHLTIATHKMSKGDFSIRLNTTRKDEIGQLTESFNHMAQELGMLEAMRKQFVSDVSHEIQSPLTSIKGFTQALKHKKMDEPSRLRLLTIIENESNRLSQLTQDLLQLSSLEYEHLTLNLTQFRLDEQIRNVIIASEPQWSPKQLEIELDLVEMTILADESKLAQLWINLIGNSIKFTGESGKIQVKGSKVNDGIEVTITDNGQGIPQDEIVHIFDPFYKVDKSRERTMIGNGIGLSIVKRIVELHHGQVQVTSQLGEWTTFRVFLPKR